MMLIVNYRNLRFHVDIVATKRSYEIITKGSAESCNCPNCRNFVIYREQLYPKEIKELFKKLGIDLHKESEVTHLEHLLDNFHSYTGWFHFKGSIIDSSDLYKAQNIKAIKLGGRELTENFSIEFRLDSTLTVFNDNQDFIKIVFFAKIPWSYCSERST